MQHSNVPSSWKYINRCLDPEGYAANFVWIPSPTEVIFNRQLRKPTFGDVAIINAELDIADTLSLSALRAAQQASILLQNASAAELIGAFKKTRDAVTLAGLIARVIVFTNCLLNDPVDAGELPGERRALERVVVDKLDTLAKNYIVSKSFSVFNQTARIQNFVEETKASQRDRCIYSSLFVIIISKTIDILTIS